MSSKPDNKYIKTLKQHSSQGKYGSAEVDLVLNLLAFRMYDAHPALRHRIKNISGVSGAILSNAKNIHLIRALTS